MSIVNELLKVSSHREPDQPFPKEYAVFGRELRDAQVPNDELSKVDSEHFLSDIDMEKCLEEERATLVEEVVEAVLREAPINEPGIQDYLERDYSLSVREEINDILNVFSDTGKMSYHDGFGYNMNI